MAVIIIKTYSYLEANKATANYNNEIPNPSTVIYTGNAESAYATKECNQDGTEINYSAGIAWETSKVYIARYELASDSSLVIQACATASIDGETKRSSMMFVGNNASTWGPYVEVMDVVSVTDAFGYKG